MKLYVIRHGESETNKTKCWTGWMDARLTEQGIEDAGVAGKLLQGISFDRVYASDLTRAMDTAKNALPGCTPTPERLLREIHVGNLSGTPIENVPVADRIRMAVDGFVAYEGESQDQFHDRIRAFLRQVEKIECENIAAFSHGGWLRGALEEVVGISLRGARISCDNCTVAIFEYTNNTWRLHSWINP
ncbi:MAG: histidine phosphatase family protein [Clostridia bacterium]|nr:histidine phosphatase family protein [Clostridia bacterium]